MDENQIQLFHNRYRHVIYFPKSKKLLTVWLGDVPESEQLDNIEYLQELIKVYEVEHFVINTNKVKSISLRPMRLLIERFLLKAYQRGAKTFTLIQKGVKREAFVINAYLNALKSYGIGMKFEIVAN